VDQSPLDVLFEADAVALAPETLGQVLRVRGLRLDAAPPIRLTELAEPLFEGIAGFAEESMGEIRAASVQLSESMREPLRTVNLRDQDTP
jgi:hypothetical protein